MRRAGWVASLLAVALLPLGVDARAQTPTWTPTYPVGTGAEHRLAALPDGTVWAVADHDDVLRSADAGLTWAPVSPVPLGTTDPLPFSGPARGGSSDTEVAPLSGSAGGASPVAYGANGDALSVTRDGGATWQVLQQPRLLDHDRGFEGIDAVEVTGGRLWLGMYAFDASPGCPGVPPTTPLLVADDPRQPVVTGGPLALAPRGARLPTFRRVDLPSRSGRVEQVRFADRSRGAVLVTEIDWEVSGTETSCSAVGVSTGSVLFTTRDGGRRWQVAARCPTSCRALTWGPGQPLLLGESDASRVRVSPDGVLFRDLPPLPLLPGLLRLLQGLDCAGQRCWASVNGGGIFRTEGGDGWVLEPSGQEVFGLQLGDLEVVDAVRVVSGGPHALLARTVVPTPASPTGLTSRR